MDIVSELVSLSEDQEKETVDETGDSANMNAWIQLGLDADAQLLLQDFGAVQRIAQEMCAARPDFSRGWLLQYLAMSHLQVPKEQIHASLEAGAITCKDTFGIQKLRLILGTETSLNRSDRPSVEVASEDGIMKPQHPYRFQADPEALDVQVFVGEWDAEGVYVYQAFNDDIADWALAHQKFGGPNFNPTRMTWIKPSLAWMLYRSGYGKKHGQNRLLKIKIAHESLAMILNHCQCVDTNKDTRKTGGEKDRDISNGRVQWDPERDLLSADGKEPRMLSRRRAIQIGLKARLSELYVQSVLSIQDVTALAHRIFQAHRSKKRDAMTELLPELPNERSYMPQCSHHRLAELGMLPGETAVALSRIGRGKAS